MFLLLALIGCAPKRLPPFEAPAHVAGWRDRIDWEDAGDEAIRVLADYVRVDTTNPPGNEAAGAFFLRRLLEGEGIATETWDLGDGRHNLIARLPGDGSEPPLCLMSHLDVVSAEEDLWTHPPLGGVIADGFLYGRGTLDMKALGAAEALAMVWLKRLDAPLRREVILLAVADEEVDNRGARLLAERWGEIGCSHLLNEGGYGIRDALFPGETLFAISVAEKGVLWARLVARGEPGHGATPMPGESPARLLAAVDDLARYRPKHRVPAPLYDALDAAGRVHGGFSGWALTRPWAVRLLVKPRLLKVPAMRAVMSNTVHLTGFDGALEPNVVPSTSTASYDVRLQPGVDPLAFAEDLRRLIRTPGVTLETDLGDVGNGSPADDPFFRALAAYATEGRTDAAAGPVLSVGFTDSQFLRPLGVRAYGFSPFEVSVEDLGRIHGNDERISIEAFRAGLRVLVGVLLDQAVSPGSE